VHPVTRVTQGTILVVLVAGVAIGSVGVAVNAGLALFTLAVPAILQRDRGVVFSRWLTVWVAGALLIHLFGMVVLYDSVWWWDHLTHMVSAALVASVGYAVTTALDEYSDALHVPTAFLWVYILLFTLAAGVFWELLEWVGRDLAQRVGVEPVLVVYGLDDTMLDLAFDVVGGVVAALVGGTRLRRLIHVPAWVTGEE
jgi:FlaA1/EpsC-like NDP-sugar epimerase